VKKVDAVALNAWVEGLIDKQKVIAVQAKGDHFTFAPLIKASDFRL